MSWVKRFRNEVYLSTKQFCALEHHTDRARVIAVDTFEDALRELVLWSPKAALRPLSIWLGGSICRGVTGIVPAGKSGNIQHDRIREIVASRNYSLNSRYEFRWLTMTGSNGRFIGAAIDGDILGRLRDVLSGNFRLMQPFIRIEPLWLGVLSTLLSKSNNDGYYSFSETDSTTVVATSGGQVFDLFHFDSSSFACAGAFAMRRTHFVHGTVDPNAVECCYQLLPAGADGVIIIPDGFDHAINLVT